MDYGACALLHFEKKGVGLLGEVHAGQLYCHPVVGKGHLVVLHKEVLINPVNLFQLGVSVFGLENKLVHYEFNILDSLLSEMAQ